MFQRKKATYREKGMIQVTTSTGAVIFCTPHFDLNIVGTEVSGTTPLICVEEPMKNPVYLVGAATTHANLTMWGTQPHACFPIDFGDQDDLDDWYDVTKIGSLNLIMTGGSAGSSAVVKVVAQQLKNY